MYRTFNLTACLLAVAIAAHAEAPFQFEHAPGKLPKSVVPVAYRIDITPDLDKLTLTGHVAIDIDVKAATTTIMLNEAGLKLASATLENGASAALTADEKAQTATLKFPGSVAAGHHTLTIDYTGPIPQTPNGIYYDDYTAVGGAKKRMLVTQFEVADARRMFPGWDEPAFKATFQLSVTLPKDMPVVSNMPIESSTPVGSDGKHVAFQNSPRMSSYLLALIAGDLAKIDGEAAGTKMSAWTPAGRQEQARYALEAEEAILPFYNDYFGVAYPLPKLDLIAIPGNYEAGAMENWGAITFIDDAMLFDPATSAPSTREGIYTTVAHEMAHQWSGDLVTMGWWDNIWLNEGFATWMENKATDHFNPSWEIWPRAHEEREGAMGQDAVPSTHPIQQLVRDESEANSAFDQISYEKGEQIIRMIEDWIGPDTFRDGMRAYMKAHAYGNATSADLWAALGTAAKRDVAHVAAGFTEQPGIPLVKIARTCRDGQAQVTLSQDRFTIQDPHPKKLTWTIPVTLGAPGAATQKVLLTEQPATVTLGSGCDTPVKANLGEDGYYRTAYDAASLAALDRIFTRLDPVDRANLLGDQFALFTAGRAALSDYLNLLPPLKDETNIAVWQQALGDLKRLDTALQGSPERKPFDAFAAGLVKPELARLGWDAKPNETFLDSVLRPKLIAALGQFNDPDTVAEAGKRFQAFLKDPAALAPALRAPVLLMVGHTADQATYDQLRKLGIEATETEEKLRYFDAMAAASDDALIKENVAFAGTGQIPNGRLTEFISEVSFRSEKPDLFYALIVPHEAELAAKLPGDGAPSVPVAAAIGSSNPATARAVQALKSSTSSTGGHVWVARLVDSIGANAALKESAVPAVAAWLSTHQG